VKEFKNDENLPIINILKKPNKGRGKGMTWKDTSLGKLRIFQRGQFTRGTRRNQVLEASPPPPHPHIVKSIVNKERGGTLERIPSIDKPSPIITTHFKIKVVYVRYNATNILYM